MRAVTSAANARSAWTRGLDGKLHTLTDAEAAAARLQAILDASRLLNIKKNNVLARVVSLRATEGDAAYVVEFSATQRCAVAVSVQPNHEAVARVEDDARKTNTRFEDYRPEGICLSRIE